MKRSLVCMGIGAGLMYLLDPELGEVRRSMLRDRFQELLPQTNEALMAKAGEVAEHASHLTEKADSVAAETVESLDVESLSHKNNGSNGEQNPEPAS